MEEAIKHALEVQRKYEENRAERKRKYEEKRAERKKNVKLPSAFALEGQSPSGPRIVLSLCRS
ncbi:hypothetical protein L195_g061428 [Trifolium pratense]|uniref:Uncharacterized protein n=1 Tax=Trifolium pratense TaxID=57577 RepID=A0A2K3K9V8_TRIPR|nr:hypothetical protein L195_g061428 [Trifolium pratense]